MMRRSVPMLALLAGLGLAGCGSPSEVLHESESDREITVESHPEVSGVLSPISLRAWVTDAGGQPVAGARVDWTVKSGGGFVGEWTNLSGPRNAADSGSTVTDSTGLARIRWGLGPLPGVQGVAIGTPGATSVLLEVDAHPGVVLLAVWQLESPLDLPSDTFRIHTTGLSSDELHEVRGWLDDDRQVRIRSGYIRAGSGIDSNWVFHLDQALVRVTDEPMLATECVSSPPLTPHAVDAILAQPIASTVCPWALEVVGIEDVPLEYLHDLQ